MPTELAKSLISESVNSAFEIAREKVPHLVNLDEQELLKQLKSDCATPSATDNRIRLAFWLEYDRAQNQGTRIRMEYIYSGACTSNYFYTTYLKNPVKVAWMLCPPAKYELILEEAVSFGLTKMRAFLETDLETLPPKDRFRLMEIQIKIYSMLEQRLKGGYTQKIEQKSLTLTGSISNQGALEAVTATTVEALDRRIKELDRRERKALNMPTKVDDLE